MLILFISGATFIDCYSVKLNTLNPNMVKISNNLVPIKEGCIVLYSDCDFEGERNEICSSISDLRQVNFDKKMSSIIVGKNTKIILRQLYDFKGNGLEINSNMRCLDNKMNHWKKRVSSVYISKVHL